MLNSKAFRAAGLRAAFFLFILLPLILPVAAHGSNGKLRVVASIAPLADFAQEVGRDRVDVLLLLPPGASPHTYEPVPRTVREISKAKIFIKIGAGLEFWADRLIAATAKGITTVTCSDGVPLLKGGDHDHALSNANPHIWLDPVICMKIVEKIAAAFEAADPANASFYRKNAAAYISRLAALDREIARTVKTFRTRDYVTFHPAWDYFARRYGLKVSGVIEEAPGKEPAPKHVQRILDAVRKMKTKVIFAEPQFSPKIADAIAQEAGARVLMLDPVGGGKGRETYIGLMKYNLAMMEKAMR
jgi:zinc transport system substrate-binding protein